MANEIQIIQTGVANTASVVAAFARAGAKPELTNDPDVVWSANRVVLPGVGAFGAGMAALREAGLVEALRERVQAGRATLAICLGMQMLSAVSEESPEAEGVAIFSEPVMRFSDAVRVPQFGWNLVEPALGSRFVTKGYAYFANSFCLRRAPVGWLGSMSDYDGRFVAAIERDGVLACQFHPELSGRWGFELLERWIRDAD